MMLEEALALRPLSFFRIAFDVPFINEGVKKMMKKPYLLPSMESLSGEEAFAEIAMGWNAEGITLQLEVDIPFEKGDCLDLFIDTRNQKTKTMTKYCHHFVFHPNEKVEEVTKFRMEDSHELADPSLLFMDCEFKHSMYSMRIHISRDALYGFEPEQFNQMGFSYILYRKGGKPQSFGYSTEEYKLAKHPQLWSEVILGGL